MHPQRKKLYKKEQRKRAGWRPMTAWLLAWIGMRFLHGAVIVSKGEV